jgi:xylose isomerase
LEVVSILPDHFSQKKWGKGAFTSTDKNIRKDAVQVTKTLMDVAADMNCKKLTIWNGQDGYDYPFTANYMNEIEWLQEGIRECADYRKDIQLAIEYKVREPRLHCYLSNVYSTLMFLKEVNRDNVGITVDFGHCIIAHENPAEAIAACKIYGDKLFHVHVNDNFGVWDDDCITSTEHVIETMEFMYWLKKTNYDGWFSFDQYTPRLDGRDALVEGLNWMEDITALVDKIDDAKMEEMFKNVNAVDMSKMVRELLFH